MKNNLRSTKIMKFKISKWLMLCLFILNVEMTQAQKNDYVWPMGYNGESTLESLENDSTNRWSPFSLNFNYDPMEIDYFHRRQLKFYFTNSSFSTDQGELICYTNGMHINGRDDQRIQGGDTINFCPYWQYNESKTVEGYGFALPQGAIFINNPGHDNQVIILTIIHNIDIEACDDIWYGIIKFDNVLNATLIQKDVSILNKRLKCGGLKVVKHANGRDWWLVAVSEDHTTFFTFLIDPNGPVLKNTQKIGRYHNDLSIINAAFSPDGSKYAVIDGQYWTGLGLLSVFSFDRCSGLLGNLYFDTISIPDGTLGTGVVFSPDNKLLYINNSYNLYQYEVGDLWKPRVHIAKYDGFQSYPHASAYRTVFGYWSSGPDGRLYSVAGSGTSKHMHIMDYPNEKGEASTFRQHALKIPNNPFSIPNFPNYRLGPLDGSPCDTLGLDNHPVAKYRYEADSIDYLRLRFTDLSYFRPETWSWDFGDGSPRVSMQSPYHTFAQKGTYNVCLTVSNENSSNTVCRTITLGTSSSDDESVSRADISLFPNPVQDYLLVTLGEYVPAYGQIMIYDITGRLVITQRIYYGQNSVDMRGFQAGMYVWKVVDGTQVVIEGKVVRI